MVDANEYREYRLMDLPGYMDWSERKLKDGAPQALMAHLDAASALLRPSDLSEISSSYFDSLLKDLELELGEGKG